MLGEVQIIVLQGVIDESEVKKEELLTGILALSHLLEVLYRPFFSQ